MHTSSPGLGFTPQVRLQHSSSTGPPSSVTPQGWGRVMWQTAREEGLGMWKGLPPRLIWVAPLSSVMFVYYELVRAPPATRRVSYVTSSVCRRQVQGIYHSKRRGDGVPVSKSAWMAAAGGPAALAAGTLIRTPFDIVEQRRQLVGLGQAPTSILSMTPKQHISLIRRQEGWRAVLCGGSATFLVRTQPCPVLRSVAAA